MSNVVTDNIGMSDSIKQTFERLEDQNFPNDINSELHKIPDGGIISQQYFEKICEKMSQMNYLELTQLRRQLKVNQDELVYAKRTADQLIELKNGLSKDNNDNLTSAIIEANAQVEAGLTDDIQQFVEVYDSTMEKLDKLIQKADENIKVFDSMPKTTSYLTDNMMGVLNKNLDRLNSSNDPSLKTIKIFYKVLHEIFSNRTSTAFLVERVKEQKNVVTRLRDAIKKDKTGSVLESTQKKVGGLFLSMFNATQLTAIENYLQKLFNDEDTAFYLQYALSCFYEHEKVYGKYGKHKWVEVMFMNITDICSDMYDLEGGKEYYDQQLLKLKDAVKDILK